MHPLVCVCGVCLPACLLCCVRPQLTVQSTQLQALLGEFVEETEDMVTFTRRHTYTHKDGIRRTPTRPHAASAFLSVSVSVSVCLLVEHYCRAGGRHEYGWWGSRPIRVGSTG